MFIVETKTKSYSLYADSVSAHSLWCTAFFAITQEPKSNAPPPVPSSASNALTDDEEPRQPTFYAASSEGRPPAEASQAYLPSASLPAHPGYAQQSSQDPRDYRTADPQMAPYPAGNQGYSTQSLPSQSHPQPQGESSLPVNYQAGPYDPRYQEQVDPRAQLQKPPSYEVAPPSYQSPSASYQGPHTAYQGPSASYQGPHVPDYQASSMSRPGYQQVDVSFDQRTETYQPTTKNTYQSSDASHYAQEEIEIQPQLHQATSYQIPRQEATVKVIYPNRASTDADYPDDPTIITSAKFDNGIRREPEERPVTFKTSIKEDVSTIQREILHPAQRATQQPAYQDPRDQQRISYQDPRYQPSSGYQDSRYQAQPEVQFKSQTAETQASRSAMIKESLDFGRAGMLDMLQDMDDFDLPKVNYQLRRPPTAASKANPEASASYVRKTVNPQSRYEEAPVYQEPPTYEEVKAPVNRRGASNDWQTRPDQQAAPQYSQAPQKPKIPEASASTKPRQPSGRVGYNPKAYQESTTESSWNDRRVELGKPMYEGKQHVEQPIASVKVPLAPKSEWDEWDN